jgi:uncharacterized membrane protein
MKPLAVLLIVLGLTLGFTYFTGGQPNWLLAGNVALAAMLLFTASGHFAFAEGMARMLPENFPARKFWVLFTGILELAAAIGLLLPGLRPLTAGALIVFFILILPANIYAACQHLDYQRGTPDGPGPGYLWLRVPLQLLFIGWAWYFGLHLAAT